MDPLQGAEWGVGEAGVVFHRNAAVQLANEPRGRKFFGYQATNRCCRDWMLLGWPSTLDGQPVKRDVSRDPVLGVPCPKCKGQVYFDIAHPDIETETEPEGAQAAVLVGGRIRG